MKGGKDKMEGRERKEDEEKERSMDRINRKREGQDGKVWHKWCNT